MSGRGQRLLGRLPAHFEATRPGKLLADVVEALATPMEVHDAELARVRRAHRLAHADHLRDVLGLGALHGITAGELAIAFARFARARALVAELAALVAAADGAPLDPAERDRVAGELFALWPIDAEALGLPDATPASVLAAYTPADPPDLDAAADNAAIYGRLGLLYADLIEALRRRIGRIAARHAAGNGTVAALLEGAANALDLQILRVVHSEDRFLHAAEVRDLIPLLRPVYDAAGRPDPVALPLATEVLGLEENPTRREVTDRVERSHGELFDILRRGFTRALLQVRVHAIGDRTVGPRLTNRDEGHGIGWAGPPLTAGQVLVFAEDGRVRRDEADVTAFAYAWQGACFAAASQPLASDFVFDGEGVDPARAARFAVATPPGALDREFAFPHDGRPLPMPGIGVGRTHYAFFVQVAHAGHRGEDDAVRAPTPRHTIGWFDNSVFAAGLDDETSPSAEVALSWLEREAYAVRLWLPPRLRALDPPREDEGSRPPIPALVARAASRFKAAGIDLRAEWIGDNWILGESVLGAAEGDDLLARLRPGTALWPTPEPS